MTAHGSSPPSQPRAGSTWACRLPVEEARWLVSPGGPLKRGGIQHLGDGVVRMDEAAVNALSSAPGDGRVVVDGGNQVMVIGWDRYPVLPDS